MGEYRLTEDEQIEEYVDNLDCQICICHTCIHNCTVCPGGYCTQTECGGYKAKDYQEESEG